MAEDDAAPFPRPGPGTAAVVVILCAVFVFEWYVLATFGFETFVWLFVARLDPSVGWVVAPFAHESLPHLVTTVVTVLVFGTFAESRLRESRFFAFLVVAAYLSTAAQVASYAVAPANGAGTLGTSGGALALTAFVVVQSLRTYNVTGRWSFEGEWVWALTGVAVLALLLANDFVPWVSLNGGTAAVGHLAGVLVGVAFGFWHPITRSGARA